MLIVTFGLWLQWKRSVILVRVCVCAIVSEICMCHKDVVGASRGAQSTVDGFNVIHTKLTDSVECSPRQAGQWL